MYPCLDTSRHRSSRFSDCPSLTQSLSLPPLSPIVALHSLIPTIFLNLRTIPRQPAARAGSSLCARAESLPMLLARAVRQHRPSFAKHPILLQAVVWKTGFASDFFVDVTAALNRVFPHRRQKAVQRVAFNQMVASLGNGSLLLVADFQERYAHHTQDEVQSQHWNQDSTTLAPCPVFFRHVDRAWVYSFVVLSDDRSRRQRLDATYFQEAASNGDPVNALRASAPRQ